MSGNDAVFGPAEDGGYWLLGLARRRRAPNLFENVRWSSAGALDDTLRSLPQAFTRKFLPTFCDIDSKADLASMGPLSIQLTEAQASGAQND